jgi:hypothetical protein
MNRMSAAVCAAALLLVSAAPALAQATGPRAPGAPSPAPAAAAPAPPAPAPIFRETANVRDTYQRLQQILQEHPPSVREVLRLDPSLLASAEYLASYPQLAAFLQQHPEVQRNASYFFGQNNFREPNPRDRAIDAFSEILAGMALFTGVMAALFVVAALLRQLIDYRRWLRQVRIQTDVHTKLLDRLTSNEDLLAYIQSPAGRNFLESAPMSSDGGSRTASAPLGRILWSVQAGVILASFGVGLWVVQGSVLQDIAPGFNIMGTVAFAVGIGFVVSAALSYVLSARLGLLAPRVQA